MRSMVVYVLVFTVFLCGGAFAANLTSDGFSAPQRADWGCFAVGQYDDGFWIGLGQRIDNKPFVLMGHMKWAALTEGKAYRTIVSFPGHLQTTLNGNAKSGNGILYDNVAHNVIAAFSGRPIFYVEFGGMFAGPYNLKGSAAALKRLNECVKEQSAKAQPAKAPPASNAAADDVQLPIRTKMNMRQCRADTAVFRDTSFGTTFEVSKVGRKGVYQCGDQPVQEPTGEDCRFFGDTVLSGTITPRNLSNLGEAAASEPASFILSVIDGSPCCALALFKGSVEQLLMKRELFVSNSATLEWFDMKEMPSLGDLGIDSLDVGIMDKETAPNFTTSLYPAECEADVLFALPQICERAASGSKDRYILGDDGIWWISGTRVVGHEYDCEILSVSDGTADVLCDMGDFGRWTDKLRLSASAGEIRIGEGEASRTLKRCEF
ncbi:MAG: hypothetical protein E5Y16_19250 [Mesorhizobium sp.]|nr:MAG: hypothetical protein EOS08_32620 [Mesorhizobium sp.]TJV34714.1 MAG: hypothetical protein E5Y16_19250 [Mesorhizobium sp.]